jgi:gluconate kinase
MPASLMASQFATLEEPGPDERPVTVSVDQRPAEIVDAIVRDLGLPERP